MTATLVTQIIGLAFMIGTLGVFAAMGYYAIKILRTLRGGILQNGWRYIAIAAFPFILGQLFLLGGAGQALANLGIAQFNIALGSILETVAGLFLVIGFRAQYSAWNPKGLESSVPNGTSLVRWQQESKS